MIIVGAAVSGVVFAQGLPKDARENIHRLFDGHQQIDRKVILLEDGYQSITESDDPVLAKTLKDHVRQMQQRLASGRMIRGWDPAFREIVAHYDDFIHQVEVTEKGLKVTVKGKTEAAIKVAKHHAKIVSGFAAKGWEAHDTRHPRVLVPQVEERGDLKANPSAAATKSSGAGKSSKLGKGCGAGNGGGCCARSGKAQTTLPSNED